VVELNNIVTTQKFEGCIRLHKGLSRKITVEANKKYIEAQPKMLTNILN
jgi:hypothetical protein